MKNAEQSEATRTALIRAARELFTERGYIGTAIEDIVQRAGVTHGALYYQFRDKSGLFRAVLEDLSLSILTKVMSAIQPNQEGQKDLWDRLVRASTDAYLDACLDPAVQRIVIFEASSVLGWEERSDVDRKYGLDLLRGVLQELMAAGLIAPQPVEPLAHLALGLATEAAMYIAHADDKPTARQEMGASLKRLHDGMRVKG